MTTPQNQHPKSSTAAAAGQSCPSWDVLPCNSYLISLLPLEDFFKYLPGIASQEEFHDLIRCMAAAWLLWIQQKQLTTTSRYRWLPNMLQNRQQLTLFALAAMDWVPCIYKFLSKQQWKLHRLPGPTTLSNSTTIATISTTRQRTAEQRRKLVWKLFQSAWPLIRLALWMQLAASSSQDGIAGDSSSLTRPAPLLYALYAHRRWLHEQGMELWPTLLRPLVESSRETREWIRNSMGWRHRR